MVDNFGIKYIHQKLKKNGASIVECDELLMFKKNGLDTTAAKHAHSRLAKKGK
jgi:hypothetical protein